MNSKYDKILESAIYTWGGEAQENMAIEECSEFIKAICKYRRSNNGTEELENIIDEIADVTIMMRQMAIMVSRNAVNDRIEFKIDRLRKKLGITNGT